MNERSIFFFFVQFVFMLPVNHPPCMFVVLAYTSELFTRKLRTEDKQRREDMALVSGGRSTLNPDAPPFIPAAYKQVEDFSPEWWQLVTTTTWYKDYWISQHQNEEGLYNDAQDVHDDGLDSKDIAGLLPDTFDLDVGAGVDFSAFDGFVEPYQAEVEKRTTPQTVPSYGNSYPIGGGGAAVVNPRLRC
ncbi:Protein EARLY RESPONSIVE TO DEHYDRATION 15 [Linum grandiflorum]